MLLFVAMLGIQHDVHAEGKIDKASCTYRGKKLQGKVQIVKNFADFKVQVVNHFSDIKVQRVSNFANSCGKWQVVNNFADFKIQIVDHFADFKVQYVNHFPGVQWLITKQKVGE